MTRAGLDADRAQITRRPDGSVTIDDPGYPLVVHLLVHPDGDRLHLARLTVDARDPAARITAAALGRLPLSQLVHLAVVRLAGGGHPNEQFYRAMARPKPAGQRVWDEDHWQRVATVYQWGQESGRPGGGHRAVADLWSVRLNPTVYRWLREVRRRGLLDGASASR